MARVFTKKNMKYLNVGCGSHFSSSSFWTNIDFASSSENVIAHNLLLGIPFDDNSFDLVYHSHVLEHFSKKDGEKLIRECNRVLKSGAVIRIAIPNLEEIAKQYLTWLNRAWENPEDEQAIQNYNWIMIEMYDQTVRNQSGGEMANYLFQDKLINEDYVFERIGDEGRNLRNSYFSNRQRKENVQIIKKSLSSKVMSYLSKLKREIIHRPSPPLNQFEKIGRFRLGGEIHQWMYDRHSVRKLLIENGFKDFHLVDAFKSYIPDWSLYNLDGRDGIIRKPDSLFLEAKKV